jgi:hypothetical protein
VVKGANKMLSKITGIMNLEYIGTKPYTLSVGGYAVTLPNGDCIYFDWNGMEGNSVAGTNQIQLILSDFEMDGDYSSPASELVNLLVSGQMTELYMEAFDENNIDVTERVKVKEFYIEYEDMRYDLLSSKNIIKKLIDIFWADIINAQVIEETRRLSSLNIWFPDSLNRYLVSMENFQKNKDYSPFSIIEPYGESLEKLDPAYYAEKRSLFYQEI